MPKMPKIAKRRSVSHPLRYRNVDLDLQLKMIPFSLRVPQKLVHPTASIVNIAFTPACHRCMNWDTQLSLFRYEVNQANISFYISFGHYWIKPYMKAVILKYLYLYMHKGGEIDIESLFTWFYGFYCSFK